VRRLAELHIHNYRSLRDATVPLGPLTALVGPNGAGKSNLLDVIRFLGDAARDDLTPALARRGGFERVRFRGEPATPARGASRRAGAGPKDGISIGLHAQVTRSSTRQAPDAYTVELSPRRAASGATTVVREERFRFRRGKDGERRITVRGGEARVAHAATGRGDERVVSRLGLQRDALGLATLPKLSDDEGADEVGRLAACLAGARFVAVDVGAARCPSGPDGAAPLRPDAANLAAFLRLLAEDDERFAGLERDAQAVVPGLIAIEVDAPGGAAAVVRLREMGLAEHTELAGASSGTVRALALLAALHDPSPPALTCVEAFDHGLAPDAVDVLAERARAASARTQLLLTTHSRRLIDALKPDELLRCERGEDGATTVTPGAA
jgi:predicted ATPase